jgi:hypothetical protein
MDGGTIANNQALLGGGVYIDNAGSDATTSTFDMSGGAVIRGNTANNFGGGVYINSSSASTGTSAFNMTGGTIGGSAGGDANTAPVGVGVYLTATSATAPSSFTLSGGSIIGNTATTGNGGGVHLEPGSYTTTFMMSGTAVIGKNSATVYGGGVSVISTATFMKSGGILYGNDGTAYQNTASGGGNPGHAAYMSSPLHYRNGTLNAGDILQTVFPYTNWDD